MEQHTSGLSLLPQRHTDIRLTFASHQQSTISIEACTISELHGSPILQLFAANNPSWSELTYCVSLLTAKNANILHHIITWM